MRITSLFLLERFGITIAFPILLLIQERFSLILQTCAEIRVLVALQKDPYDKAAQDADAITVLCTGRTW